MRTIFCEPETSILAEESVNYEVANNVSNTITQIEEKPEGIDYIGGMFPRGKLSALIGDIATGKSTVLAAVSLTVTDGDVFLNASSSKSNGRVLLINTDASSDIFINKFSDFGGTPKSIIFPSKDAFTDCMSSLKSSPINYFSERYQKKILKCVEEFEPDLVLIDSFAGFIDVNENSSDVIQRLTWLAELATHYNTAVVFTHLTNGLEREQERVSLNCIRGFAGIPQIPVVIWAIELLPDGKHRKLYQIKNNLELLNTQEYIIAFGDSEITFADKIPQSNFTKTERRYKLFDANKDKSTIELIQLLQRYEPDTLYEAAKQAVVRWRKSKK